ncbi:hypothetical protein H4R26_002899 [Coemansia thaxteri]|uniref:Uncharacterized protein n=1 Tax=Coemansia thaxteri TaxID=2663907 RepID=A0A9W8EJP7_9FUNG|nr:hypothetical protein H4R26_002899 [Coemansia thaxteri]
MDQTNIEYPDETQMTGNTGTAVSGNNNDIMPIINAPVTVIINSSDNSRHRQTGSHVSPPSLPQMQQPAQRPAPVQARVPDPASWANTTPPQQPQLLADMSDPFGMRIQQLIAYALAMSQGHP